MKITNKARRPVAALACLLLMLAGSGCSTKPQLIASAPLRCDQPGSNCPNELLKALEDWQEAYNSRDPQRLQSLYAPGALITDDEYAAVPLSGAAVPLFFDEMVQRPTARMRWFLGNLQWFGETAVRSGEYESTEQVDCKPNVRPARYSFVYQRFDGRWLIILQHTTLRP